MRIPPPTTEFILNMYNNLSDSKKIEAKRYLDFLLGMTEEEFMKPKNIYICSPFRANEHGTQEENIEHARSVGEKVKALGHDAIVPHILLSHIDEATDRALALNEGLKLLGSCTELWICSKHITGGMLGEMQYAIENGITIINRGGMI